MTRQPDWAMRKVERARYACLDSWNIAVVSQESSAALLRAEYRRTERAIKHAIAKRCATIIAINKGRHEKWLDTGGEKQTLRREIMILTDLLAALRKGRV